MIKKITTLTLFIFCFQQAYSQIYEVKSLDKKIKLFLLLLVLSFSVVSQQKRITLLSKATVTQTGYCSDGTDREKAGKLRFHGPMEAKIITFNEYQYISYYEANGDVVVARKNIKLNSNWEKSILPGYKIQSEDRHNKIALSISKGDGVIHIAFDHHNTPQFNYAHSKVHTATNPTAVVWDNSVFKLQPNLGLKEETGLVTYPTFYQLNATGNLVVYWRTGGAVGGEMNLANYNSINHKWYFIGRISSQEGTYLGKTSSRGPYISKFLEDTEGVLHVSWLFRERAFADEEGKKGNFGEHGLYYAQSSDGGFTWKNNLGVIITDVKRKKVMGIDTMQDLSIEIPMHLNPVHTELTSIIDPVTNNFITLLNHYKPNTKQKKNFLYMRSPKGDWIAEETNLKQKGEIKMVGDIMYSFTTSGIYFAERSSNFTNWNALLFPISFKNGNANWDTSNLEKGSISMVIQYIPEKIGTPTPVEVFNFKLLN